jgi:S1-C subfamily serine protease
VSQKRWRGTNAVLLCAALVGGVSGCGSSPEQEPAASAAAASAAEGSAVADGSVVAPVGLASIPAIVAQVDPSVVTIAVGSRGIGSGVVYREGGYVVTNAHVVGQADRVDVELADGTRTSARVLATDEITDLAVVRTERRDLPAAKFETAQPRVGELVLAMGSPLGFQNSAAVGIVSGLGREIPGAAAQGARSLVDLIQTDAAISPGNSGGALVNGEGEIVGINEAYLPPAVGAVSIGFAIPAATVVDVVDQLIADGSATHPFLGAVVATLTPQIAQAFAIQAEDGALIQSVAPGGPADSAGMRAGDVMVSFNGSSVRSAEDFLGALRGTEPGQVVKIDVGRGAAVQTLTVTIGTLPAAG